MESAPVSRLRCLVVWAAVTALLVIVLVGVVPLASTLSHAAAWVDFAALLPRLCAALLVGSGGWIWVITTVTTAELLLDPSNTRPDTHHLLRRGVLLLCGVTLASSPLATAHADEGTRSVAPAAASQLLNGLPFPDRVLGAAPPAAPGPRPSPRVVPQPTGPTRVTVAPGDSLWWLARTSLPAHRRTAADIDRRWRALYAANRTAIGSDPDLLTPGLILRLPSAGQPEER